MKHGFSALPRTLTLFCMMFFAALMPAVAAEQADPPISIEANRMISQEKDNTVIFLGQVDARQGTLTIRAEEMTVYYSNNKGKNKTKAAGAQAEKPTSKVDKLICKKNVKVNQGDWLGTGDRMDYFAAERKVVLQGNAKAWQGQNMVTGKTITYYLDQKRSVVEQDTKSQGRVRAVIHPETKK